MSVRLGVIETSSRCVSTLDPRLFTLGSHQINKEKAMLKKVIAITALVGAAAVVPTVAWADQAPDGGGMMGHGDYVDGGFESWDDMIEWMHDGEFDGHGMAGGGMMGHGDFPMDGFGTWDDMVEWMDNGDAHCTTGSGISGGGSMMGPGF
jgi:hypothetical protein